MLASVALAGSDQISEQTARPLCADSAAPYVHRLTLYDHDGTAISPDDVPALPYSPRTTCGKCHDYATISRGWHFNAPDRSGEPGRCGEPWFLVDSQSGTLLPISGRSWPGTYTPEEARATNWQFVLRFGHHTPGGGFGEPPDEIVAGSPEVLRWGVSGKLEIDCMFCHSADQQHDPAEAARQIELENFRWAPTVAFGLGVVRGEARKAPDDWDPMMPADPDHPEQAGPTLIYDHRRFDPDDRVFFNITRRPPAERCYFCHFAREVGPGTPDRIEAAQDVHLAAGLTCVDCHRNGLDHMIVRGYATEAEEHGDPSLAAFTCEGCHLGSNDADDASISLGGRYGAPHPQHKGLPPVHFEKLTCTACHSGPWPETYAKRFQTALAHGLGLATREREDDDPPRIVGPIFARQHDGKIAPQQMVWGAGRGQAGKTDLKPGTAHYRWSIAHSVRPALQSLGINECTDCHADDAPIFFGRITHAGDEVAGELPVRLMHELRGDDPSLASAWNAGLWFRAAFKWLAFACVVVVGLILLHYVLGGIGAITRRFR